MNHQQFYQKTSSDIHSRSILNIDPTIPGLRVPDLLIFESLIKKLCCYDSTPFMKLR